MSITQAQLRLLSKEMQSVFDAFDFTDFTIDAGPMRYGLTDVTVRVTAKLKGVQSTSDALFESKVAELGLKMVGVKGQKLTGYTQRRHKYPFSYETVRGARYKCSVAQAKEIFG